MLIVYVFMHNIVKILKHLHFERIYLLYKRTVSNVPLTVQPINKL